MTDQSVALGLKIKRRIALTALMCGLPAIPFLAHPSLLVWILGTLFALVYANAFEYAYHRWPLHLPNTAVYRRHLVHHHTVGRDNEAEHTTFGGGWFTIFLLFALNSIPFLIFDFFTHLWVTPVALVAFTAYFLALEEAHWRIHMGLWVPFGAGHHLGHHDIPTKQYNVYIPLFDWLLGTMENR